MLHLRLCPLPYAHLYILLALTNWMGVYARHLRSEHTPHSLTDDSLANTALLLTLLSLASLLASSEAQTSLILRSRFATTISPSAISDICKGASEPFTGITDDTAKPTSIIIAICDLVIPQQPHSVSSPPRLLPRQAIEVIKQVHDHIVASSSQKVSQGPLAPAFIPPKNPPKSPLQISNLQLDITAHQHLLSQLGFSVEFDASPSGEKWLALTRYIDWVSLSPYRASLFSQRLCDLFSRHGPPHLPRQPSLNRDFFTSDCTNDPGSIPPLEHVKRLRDCMTPLATSSVSLPDRSSFHPEREKPREPRSSTIPDHLHRHAAMHFASTARHSTTSLGKKHGSIILLKYDRKVLRDKEQAKKRATRRKVARALASKQPKPRKSPHPLHEQDIFWSSTTMTVTTSQGSSPALNDLLRLLRDVPPLSTKVANLVEDPTSTATIPEKGAITRLFKWLGQAKVHLENGPQDADLPRAKRAWKDFLVHASRALLISSHPSALPLRMYRKTFDNSLQSATISFLEVLLLIPSNTKAYKRKTDLLIGWRISIGVARSLVPVISALTSARSPIMVEALLSDSTFDPDELETTLSTPSASPDSLNAHARDYLTLPPSSVSLAMYRRLQADLPSH